MTLPFFNNPISRRDREQISGIAREYEHSAFVEPFFSTINVILATEPVEFEVIGESDPESLDFLRALRDEPEWLLSKLRKIKYSKAVFDRECLKLQKDKEEKKKSKKMDYAERAVSCAVQYGMSVGHRGDKYSAANENRYNKFISELPKIAERIKVARIIERPPLEIINAFSEQNYLCIAIPPIDMTASAKKILFKSLANYRGTVIAMAHESWTEPEKWKFTTKYGAFYRAVQQNTLEGD